MNKLRNTFALFTLALLLTGCASVGTEPAQTFNQKLAYATGLHTSILQAATSAVSAGTLSSADAESVLKGADNAKIALDTAKAANEAGDQAGANAKLAVALTSLTALQDYLRAHQGASP